MHPAVEVELKSLERPQVARIERPVVLALCTRGELEVGSRLGEHARGAGQWLVHADPSPLVVRVGPGSGAILVAAAQPLPLPRCKVAFPAVGEDPEGLVRDTVNTTSRVSAQSVAEMFDALLWAQSLLAERCPGRTLHHRRQLFARLQTARIYLGGHLDQPPSLERLGALVAISRCHFVRVYRGVFGMTPLEDHHEMRMAHAARLLSSTALPIGDVALRCGFDAGCTFARAFRMRFSTTPTQWRERGNAQSGHGPRATRAPAARHAVGTVASAR